VTTYVPPANGVKSLKNQAFNVSIFPNPASDIIAIQVGELNSENCFLKLMDIAGKVIDEVVLYQGSTIAYFDARSLYNGDYLVEIQTSQGVTTRKVSVLKD